MKYIFTLSGNSDRFTKEGFIPKPLIKINDRMVIEFVIDIFSGIEMRDATFIVNDRDNKLYNIYDIIKDLYPDSSVISIPPHSMGPVVSIIEIETFIVNNEPYIVSYCDLAQKWNYQNFLNKMKETNCDGCMVTHTGKHPHRLKAINFAHVLLDGIKILKVKEKGWFSNDPMSEYASNGIYYFKNGEILKKYCHRIIENKETINGEYYVTLVYNQMIKDGLNVIHYPTDNYVCLGTPFELISFKYWKSLIDNKISDEEINFIKTYWKNYHDTNQK